VRIERQVLHHFIPYHLNIPHPLSSFRKVLFLHYHFSIKSHCNFQISFGEIFSSINVPTEKYPRSSYIPNSVFICISWFLNNIYKYLYSDIVLLNVFVKNNVNIFCMSTKIILYQTSNVSCN
jgi:hypothetical protein